MQNAFAGSALCHETPGTHVAATPPGRSAKSQDSPFAHQQPGLLAPIGQSSDDAIVGTRLDGRILSWNAVAERLYGFSADEMVGLPVATIIPRERHRELNDVLARVTGGEKVDPFQTTGRARDGRSLSVSIMFSQIRNNHGTIVGAAAIVRDATNGKHAVEAEREAAARLRAVVETAVDGIITIDEHGIIETVNPAAVRLFGFEPPELIGRNVNALMPEPYRSGHDGYVANYLRSGEPRVIGIGREVEGKRKDGSVFPMELAVTETRLADRRVFTGIVRDITERRRAAEVLHSAVQERTAELGAANQKLRLEIEQRTRAEKVLAGENRVLELIATGASMDEALGAICAVVDDKSAGVRCSIRVVPEDLVPQNGAKSFGSASLLGLSAALVADHRARRIVTDLREEPVLRHWARRSKLRAVWLEPVLGASGQYLGAITIGFSKQRAPTDHELELGTSAARLAGIVIDKARADDRSRKQLAQLAHVSRLATMGEMASGLAHELNQPLCAIVNFAEACLELLETKPTNADLRQAMTEVARQAERAGEVIRRLREFVRRRELQRVVLPVNQAVREVIGLTNAEIRQNQVSVKLSLGRRLPGVLADSIQIQQVLVNLVRNAIDAMTEAAVARRHLRIKTCRSGDYIEVAVSDSGSGIDGGAIEQVFESFYTTKAHGMGMGLSISRSIVEMHDGRLWVTPNADCGVTFHFTIPVARGGTR